MNTFQDDQSLQFEPQYQGYIPETWPAYNPRKAAALEMKLVT